MAKQQKCPPGCACARHTNSGGRKCEPGCTCARHRGGPIVDWNDPEAKKAYMRQKAKEKYAADPERFKEAQRKYAAKKRAEDPDYWRKHHKNEFTWLKYSHGIGGEQFHAMLDAQDGRCYLCAVILDPDAPRGVHVDHDHACCPGARSCGKCIRGLACHRCNTGIGAFGDDPDQMERVAQNLRAANRRLRDPGPRRGEQQVIPLNEEESTS